MTTSGAWMDQGTRAIMDIKVGINNGYLFFTGIEFRVTSVIL